MSSKLRGYVALAVDLRAGKTTPRAYLDECLKRIAELDDALEGFLEVGARRGLAGAEIGRQSDIAPELACGCTHGRTAGVSNVIPRARHIR